MDWKSYRDWLNKGYSKRTAQQLYNYALKHNRLLNDGFGCLHGFSEGKRRLVLKSLAALSKYLGCYSRFKHLKEESGVKWGARNNFEVFKKLYNENGDDGLYDWIKQVKTLPQQYAFPIVFQGLTGLRPSEAIAALNIIAEKGLNGYYNSGLGVLEHFKYPETFLRNTKNAFISIITPTLVERLKIWHEITSWNTIRLKLRRSNIPIKLQALRSNYATILREAGIASEAIDMLQGRIPASVFARYYYKPSLSGLVDKVKEALKPLETELVE